MSRCSYCGCGDCSCFDQSAEAHEMAALREEIIALREEMSSSHLFIIDKLKRIFREIAKKNFVELRVKGIRSKTKEDEI